MASLENAVSSGKASARSDESNAPLHELEHNSAVDIELQPPPTPAVFHHRFAPKKQPKRFSMLMNGGHESVTSKILLTNIIQRNDKTYEEEDIFQAKRPVFNSYNSKEASSTGFGSSSKDSEFPLDSLSFENNQDSTCRCQCKKPLEANKKCWAWAYFPPVATTLCVLNVLVYLFREKVNIVTEENIHVSWEAVIVRGDYWRLFVAQFVHFSKTNLVINSVTLFAIGCYLEKKITSWAMFIIILMMSATTQLAYITIDPWICNTPQSAITFGFGNICHGLRILLAYALEPRYRERDLVFGLYPRIVSVTQAPWQMLLEILMFKFVFPEQCLTGQVAGFFAGFFVTTILLVIPWPGVYISDVPYVLSIMNESRERQKFMRSDVDLWLPSASEMDMDDAFVKSMRMSVEKSVGHLPIWKNALQIRSEKLRSKVSRFLAQPGESVAGMIKSLGTIAEVNDQVHPKRNSHLYPGTDIASPQEINRRLNEVLLRRNVEAVLARRKRTPAFLEVVRDKYKNLKSSEQDIGKGS